jgi:hypothetical protein
VDAEMHARLPSPSIAPVLSVMMRAEVGCPCGSVKRPGARSHRGAIFGQLPVGIMPTNVRLVVDAENGSPLT